MIKVFALLVLSTVCVGQNPVFVPMPQTITTTIPYYNWPNSFHWKEAARWDNTHIWYLFDSKDGRLAYSVSPDFYMGFEISNSADKHVETYETLEQAKAAAEKLLERPVDNNCWSFNSDYIQLTPNGNPLYNGTWVNH